MLTMSIGANLMQDSAKRLSVVANNVANAHTPGFQRGETGGQARASEPDPAGETLGRQGDTTVPLNDVDLATEMIDMLQIEHAYSLGAKLVSVGDEMAKETLDILR